MANETGITKSHLKIARLIYGFDTQEDLAREMGVSLATVQRYESLDDVDARILGVYTHQLNFDISKIVFMVDKMRQERNHKNLKGQVDLSAV